MNRTRHNYRQGIADSRSLAKQSLAAAHHVLTTLYANVHLRDNAYTNGYADGVASIEAQLDVLLAHVMAAE